MTEVSILIQPEGVKYCIGGKVRKLRIPKRVLPWINAEKDTEPVRNFVRRQIAIQERSL